MKTKKQILSRKALHLSLLIPFGVFWWLNLVMLDLAQAQAFMLVVLGAFVIYEYVRLDLRMEVPFGRFIKPKEENTTVDGLNLIMACLLIHLLVPLPVAIAATLIAIIGDAASTMGALYGKIRVFPNTTIKTTWEGVVLSLFVNMTVSASILGFVPAMLVMSISAIMIETAVQKVDDNIAVPILIAGLGSLTQWLSM